MTEIKFDNLGEHLVTAIPELRSQYESELEWWGDEQSGAHIIFGDILNPYLISLLELGDREDTIKRIFAFLEQLANHEDTQIQEVVAVTVCERLGDNKNLLAKARQYMGNTTLCFSDQIEEFWGREKAIAPL
ncbi:hypothetical protein H6S82_09850 [Planktothrix sp. FACHB-1355]|uniref:DUF7674 domain-containing protein n=1 Tax=Aerosakkonema funiforme FACHB-1375 TaxID=2949571 RepID=A0A926ZJS4_9CYAN|nr:MULTISPECIES: hypothetical protein [Oscillatoriales]MBD2185315.1 hypothetical protein [Aerosakkonema funiforme FACHB-1375]MBD3559162.1 hypothetical protein [Planktothrix sp. FACHB-1355]